MPKIEVESNMPEPFETKKKKLIVVGDRVLIEPDDENKTKVGLYLPQGAIDKKQVRGGTVITLGPGAPLPDPNASDDEPWKSRSAGKYMPMQAQKGDYALFFRRSAVDISYEGKDYVIVPEASILLLIRAKDSPEGSLH
jgi:chaperonin GroES